MGFPKLDSTRVALHHSGTGRPREADLARGMAYRLVERQICQGWLCETSTTLKET
jgi:hypothetical protein